MAWVQKSKGNFVESVLSSHYGCSQVGAHVTRFGDKGLYLWIVSHRPQVNWSFWACLGYCSWSGPASIMNAALSQQGKVHKGNWSRSVVGGSSAGILWVLMFPKCILRWARLSMCCLDVRQGNLIWNSFRASNVLTCPVNTTKGCSLPTRRVGWIQTGKKGWKQTVVGTKL